MELTSTVFLISVLKVCSGLEFLGTLLNRSALCLPYNVVDHASVTILEDEITKGTSQTTIHIQCNPGYDLQGPPKLSCVDGIWEQIVRPHCIPRCPPPPFVANGGFQIEGEKQSDGTYKKGTLATYECSDGFMLTPPDSHYRVCEKGLWTGPNATCLEKVMGCEPPKEVENGYFQHEKQGLYNGVYSIGLRLHYSCKEGFDLVGPPMLQCLDHATWSPKLPPDCVPQTNGNERFTQYLASSNTSFQLSNFVDKSGVQSAVGARTGYDMSPFIRRYARYINEKALSYRAVAFDFCKVKRGKEEGTLRTMNAENLLKTLPILQSQLDALLEFDCTANDLTNGVINVCFMLLFRDLIRLFACYNDGIINLLEKYFEMNKKQCRDALDLYKKFLIRMDRVGEFLKVAENIGIDKGDIPDLTKAPNSLLDALEQHLASLEGNTPTQVASNQKNLKTGVSALSSTGNAFGSVANNGLIEDTLQAAVAEEEAALNKYKANLNSPPNSSTNPFLSSPTKAPGSDSILDLFGGDAAPTAPPAPTQTSSKAIDDLLQLGNPFADVPAAGPTDLFGNTSTNANVMFSAPSAPATNTMWSNGMAGQPAYTQSQFGSNLTNVFTANSNEPSVFDPLGGPSVAAPIPVATQPQPVRPPQPTQKLLTGDLESSLSLLADNLTIDTGRNAPMNWSSPKNQPKTTAVGWQPQLMAATTGPGYKPMGQPMQQFPMTTQPMMMGSPKVGNAEPAVKQEVSFDPFGNL